MQLQMMLIFNLSTVWANNGRHFAIICQSAISRTSKFKFKRCSTLFLNIKMPLDWRMKKAKKRKTTTTWHNGTWGMAHGACRELHARFCDVIMATYRVFLRLIFLLHRHHHVVAACVLSTFSKVKIGCRNKQEGEQSECTNACVSVCECVSR